MPMLPAGSYLVYLDFTFRLDLDEQLSIPVNIHRLHRSASKRDYRLFCPLEDSTLRHSLNVLILSVAVVLDLFDLTLVIGHLISIGGIFY